MNENLLIAISGIVMSTISSLIIWSLKRDFKTYDKLIVLETELKNLIMEVQKMSDQRDAVIILKRDLASCFQRVDELRNDFKDWKNVVG